MKKILSVVAALSVFATMMTSFVSVYADQADFVPTITATVTSLSNDEFKDIMDEDIPEGDAAYNLHIALSDFGEIGKTKSGAKYSGRVFQVNQLDLVAINEYADRDYFMAIDGCIKGTVTEGFNAKTNRYVAAQVGATVTDCYPLDAGTTETEIPDVYNILVVLNTTDAVTIDVEYTFGFVTYTKSVPGDTEEGMVTTQVTFAQEEETKDPTVANLELDKTSVNLDLNGTTSATVKATVTMDPAEAEAAAVEWTSNNTDVATVEDGVITAKAVGDATITATAGDHSVEVAVKVVDTTPVGPTVLQEGDQFPDSVVVAAAKEGNVLTYVKTVSAGVSATKHAKLTNKTKGESIVTERNIAQLLGGEAEDGATIEGAIVVVVSGAEGDEFDFEIVD
jgi:hypothetical protein